MAVSSEDAAMEPLRVQRRLTWNTAYSDSFPSDMVFYLMQASFRIQLVRWCSVPGETGKLQLFFRRNDNGARQDQWEKFFIGLGFTPIHNVDRGNNRELWRSFIATISGEDQRTEELMQNVQHLSFNVPRPLNRTHAICIQDVMNLQMQASKFVVNRRADIEEEPPACKRNKTVCQKKVALPIRELAPKKPHCENLFRDFLQTANVYDIGSLSISEVIQSLIPMEVRARRENHSAISAANKSGVIGLLYPSSDDESTLELHRRALRLEGALEALICVLMDQIEGGGDEAIALSVADVSDIQFAFQFHGGVPR